MGDVRIFEENSTGATPKQVSPRRLSFSACGYFARLTYAFALLATAAI